MSAPMLAGCAVCRGVTQHVYCSDGVYRCWPCIQRAEKATSPRFANAVWVIGIVVLSLFIGLMGWQMR